MLKDGLPTIAKNCPGVSGGVIDLNFAGFKLCAEIDPYDTVRGRHIINVKGLFYMPGELEDDPDVLMQSIEIGIPDGTPAAAMVELILNDETGFIKSEVGRILVSGAVACNCVLANQCPGMDEAMLLFAIQAAIANPESAV